MKMQIMKDIIKLNILQNDGEKIIKKVEANETNEIKENVKYETKIYHFNNINILNNNEINFEFNDFKIVDLSFFMNFIGNVGTIIFCNNNNPSEIPINSLYGLKSNKISTFI